MKKQIKPFLSGVRHQRFYLYSTDKIFCLKCDVTNHKTLQVYMSGHSHWSGIKHKKALIDAKRAKIFAKCGKLIAIAAREGGGNPENNPKLKFAIEQAHAANVPKENIERAIKKGTGEIKGEAIEEIAYEAFGPGGIMMIIKVVTDNKKRAVSEIKAILSDFGGKLGESGSVTWNFEKTKEGLKPKNLFLIDEEVKSRYDKLLETLRKQDDVEEICDNLQIKNKNDASKYKKNK